jgi:ribosomal protein L37AE/L43A
MRNLYQRYPDEEPISADRETERLKQIRATALAEKVCHRCLENKGTKESVKGLTHCKLCGAPVLIK